MKSLCLIVALLFALPNMAQSGEKTSIQRNALAHHEISGGLMLHPRGLGINVKSSLKKGKNSWRMLDFDLLSMRHEKERRVRSSSFSAPGSFFYGKLNQVYFVRSGFGQRWEFGQRLYKNTLSASMGVSGGLTFAFLKPVYLEIYYPLPDQQAGYLVSEKYDPLKHTDLSVIFGNSSVFKGMGELGARIGLNAKANIQFDWSDYYDQIQSLELGIALDAFGRDIPILAFAQNKNVFTSLYICLNIGNRW